MGVLTTGVDEQFVGLDETESVAVVLLRRNHVLQGAGTRGGGVE